MPRSPSLRPLRAQSRHGAPADNPAVDWSQRLLTAADIALLGLNITAETLNGIPFLKGIVVAGSEIIRRARDASSIKKDSDALARSIQREVALVVDKLCNNEKTMDLSLEQDVDGLLTDLIAVYSDLKKLKNGYFSRFWTLDSTREALGDCKRAIDAAFKDFQMRTSLASQQRQIQNHEELKVAIAAAVHTLQQPNACDSDEAPDTDAASGYSYDRPMFPGEEPDTWDAKLGNDASDESRPYVSWVRRVVKVADGIMTGVKQYHVSPLRSSVESMIVKEIQEFSRAVSSDSEDASLPPSYAGCLNENVEKLRGELQNISDDVQGGSCMRNFCRYALHRTRIRHDWSSWPDPWEPNHFSGEHFIKNLFRDTRPDLDLTAQQDIPYLATPHGIQTSQTTDDSLALVGYKHALKTAFRGFWARRESHLRLSQTKVGIGNISGEQIRPDVTSRE